MALWTVLFLGILGLFSGAGCDENTNYDHYTLVRLVPKNLDQVKAIQDFEDAAGQVEVLKRSRDLFDSFDVLVPVNRTGLLEEFAGRQDLEIDAVKPNYGRTFEAIDRVPKRRSGKAFKIFGYNSHAAINEYLEEVQRKNPDLVTLQNLGTSYQGRPMVLAKISTDPKAGNPIIFVDAGIHAREWVAPAMAVYLIHRLMRPAARSNELREVDWHILPVVNPDGYDFSRSARANRLWRKTRSKTDTYSCLGVDGNRNYGYRWGVSGVSTNPCNKETYAGPKPFSEVETQHVRDALMEYRDRIKLYVSLHAYGQYLVYPWGYTGDFLPKEWKKLDSLARSVSNAVQRAGGQPFRVMSAGKWYAAAGGSDDFAFGSVGVPYSYTMELTDGYEFVFPEKNLNKVLPQFYEGFKVFAQNIRSEFGGSGKLTKLIDNPIRFGDDDDDDDEK